MILAEIDYTIPTVAMLMVVYALVDKVIVPLIKKHKSSNESSDSDQQSSAHHERHADIQRRLAAVEAGISENWRLLSTLRTEVSVAAAILERIEKR